MPRFLDEPEWYDEEGNLVNVNSLGGSGGDFYCPIIIAGFNDINQKMWVEATCQRYSDGMWASYYLKTDPDVTNWGNYKIRNGEFFIGLNIENTQELVFDYYFNACLYVKNIGNQDVFFYNSKTPLFQITGLVGNEAYSASLYPSCIITTAVGTTEIDASQGSLSLPLYNHAEYEDNTGGSPAYTDWGSLAYVKILSRIANKDDFAHLVLETGQFEYDTGNGFEANDYSYGVVFYVTSGYASFPPDITIQP